MTQIIDTSSDQAQARTTALQRTGINLYRYDTYASTKSDNLTVYKFWITRKDERIKERLQEIMTLTTLNQCAPDRAPLDIPLRQRLTLPRDWSDFLAHEYMSREQDSC